MGLSLSLHHLQTRSQLQWKWNRKFLPYALENQVLKRFFAQPNLFDKKGLFPKGWFWRMFPRNENRNDGAFAKTTLLRNRPFISQWAPFWCWQKGYFQKGGFGGCSPERKPERGYVRQNHPFAKPPFYLPVMREQQSWLLTSWSAWPAPKELRQLKSLGGPNRQAPIALGVALPPPSMRKSELFGNFNGCPPISQGLSIHFGEFSVNFNQFHSTAVSFSQALSILISFSRFDSVKSAGIIQRQTTIHDS